jgi:hypothetical protein
MRVIYIAGTARTGSTLIDNLLAQAQDVCSVGEFRNIWKQGLLEDGLCGCGARVAECEFWQPVLERVYGSSVPAERLLDLQDRFLRFRRSNVLGLLRSKEHAAPAGLREYVQNVEAVYRSAAAQSGASVVLDSSKTPLEPFALRQLTDLDLRVIHLVRDPRGVAFSAAKKKEAPDRASGRMRESGPLTASSRWLLHNGVSAYFRAGAQGRYLRYRYEDFVDDPNTALAQMARFAGIAGVPSIGPDGRTAVTVTHGPAGNPDRLRRRDSALVRPDVRWKSEMRPMNRFLATVPAAPLLPGFGYALWPSSRAGSGEPAGSAD